MGKKQMAAHVCVAIDPDNCGSTVMGYVYRATTYKGHGTHRHVRSGGKVVLSDCGRSITWEIGRSDGGAEKLNRAIRALTVLRDALRREEPKVRKLERDAREHNKKHERRIRRLSELEI